MAEYGVATISVLMPHSRLRPRAADLPRSWNTTQPSPISATHIGKRLAEKLHEPFERAGGGRAKTPPLPTLQRRRPCNGAGAKGLCCSALVTGQLETGGARGRGKAVQDPEAGGLGGLQACEGQPGSGWRGWTVDCGVRGQPIGQPLQALEPTIVRELLSSAGAAGRYSEGRRWYAPVGHPDGRGSHRSGGRPSVPGAVPGSGVSRRHVRLQARSVGDRCRAPSPSALLAV